MISVVATNRPCSFPAISSCQISNIEIHATSTASEIPLACGAPVPWGCFSILIQLRHHSLRMLPRKGVSHF